MEGLSLQTLRSSIIGLTQQILYIYLLYITYSILGICKDTKEGKRHACLKEFLF